MKHLLIISNGPVPPMRHAKIEGSGQRCWGLATGLDRSGYDVTVAVRDTYPLEDTSHGSIHLVSWLPGKSLARLANRYDTVIISYSMGRIASDLAQRLDDSVIYILDCYVPIYLEISGRPTKDLRRDYPNYMVDLGYFNTALRRGDYFLCANEPQKHFYTGVLSALGVINPHSYAQKRLLPVPFGIDSEKPEATRNPYLELGIGKKDFVLLWFGGLYPWYDITPLLKSVAKASTQHNKLRLVVVGAKNPYNRNPAFTKPYDTALAYAKKHKLLNDTVHFVDWVDFDERGSWYRHADAAISIQNPGEENIYSWRTRIMDHVWGGVPLITNGGDPLCEMELSHTAAIRLPALDEESITGALKQIASDKTTLKRVRANLDDFRKSFYWEKVVTPISEVMAAKSHPYLQEKKYAASIGFSPFKTKLTRSRAGRIAVLPARAVRKVHSDGVKGSLAALRRRLPK